VLKFLFSCNATSRLTFHLPFSQNTSSHAKRAISTAPAVKTYFIAAVTLSLVVVQAATRHKKNATRSNTRVLLPKRLFSNPSLNSVEGEIAGMFQQPLMSYCAAEDQSNAPEQLLPGPAQSAATGFQIYCDASVRESPPKKFEMFCDAVDERSENAENVWVDCVLHVTIFCRSFISPVRKHCEQRRAIYSLILAPCLRHGSMLIESILNCDHIHLIQHSFENCLFDAASDTCSFIIFDAIRSFETTFISITFECSSFHKMSPFRVQGDSCCIVNALVLYNTAEAKNHHTSGSEGSVASRRWNFV